MTVSADEAAPGPHLDAPAGLSLRQRTGRSVLALALVQAVLFAVVVFTLVAFKHRGDDLINRWQPAYTLSQDLLSDMVNQETGLRGFVLGRRAEFLDPYLRYRDQQTLDERRLRRILVGRGDLTGLLDSFDAAARAWRAGTAEPFIARARAGDTSVADAVGAAPATSAFDSVRTAAAALTARITAARATAKDERSQTGFYLVAALAGTALVLIVAVTLYWRQLRRSVLLPVERLADQARKVVATGELHTPIVASGPIELVSLGQDVDAMRARIADELERVEQARTVLLARSEDLARSNADLEQFAYVASHDLSEPLRKIANFCQLLERQYGPQLDDKARQYIDFAVDGAKRMQVLITDLLEFSRVGRGTEGFAQVDIGAVVARAMVNLDQRIVESGATVTAHDLPTVQGDASLLIALFQNLIGNALKYRSEQPPRIDIAATRIDAGWQFTVSDNGIGIDKKYADRIFAIFQRLHLRDQYGGTGIGLALCRRIVEFHGGRIWLAPSDGQGASFQFSLTRRPRGRNDPSGRYVMSSEPPDEPARPLGILLVEDDPGDVLIAREAMAAGRLSSQLSVVSDGAEAMAYLRRVGMYSDVPRPDLILLDLNLPRMSGHEVLAEVKADPDLRRIPVVVLTTSSTSADIAKSYDLHASVYVTKPVDFDSFTDVVKQIDSFFRNVAELPEG